MNSFGSVFVPAERSFFFSLLFCSSVEAFFFCVPCLWRQGNRDGGCRFLLMVGHRSVAIKGLLLLFNWEDIPYVVIEDLVVTDP